MITVSSVVHQIITSSPLLEEGMSRGLLNISALARSIQPEVARLSKKSVSEAAIVMSLKRMHDILPDAIKHSKVSIPTPDLIIRSNLVELTYQNSSVLNKKQQRLLSLIADYRSQYFMTITTGVFETTIIASKALEPAIKKILQDESLTTSLQDLSSITVRLSSEMIQDAGSYAAIMRQLAWENINIVEVVSTYQELTLIVRSIDADRTFSVLRLSN